MQPKTFAEYVTKASALAGSDATLGRVAGLTDGSRVGNARRGGLRLSELACLKLARFTGDDPCWVLRLAGYGEMADLLQGHVAPPQMDAIKLGLRQLQSVINLALQTTGEDTNGKTHRDPKASRRVRG